MIAVAHGSRTVIPEAPRFGFLTFIILPYDDAA